MHVKMLQLCRWIKYFSGTGKSMVTFESFPCSLKSISLLSRKKPDWGEEYAAVLSRMFSVPSNYLKSFLHSCEVADFVSFNIPRELYSHFSHPFTISWAFSGRVALESVVKSGGVEAKLGWFLEQNTQTRVCPCAYTMVVQKTKPVPAKGTWKICASLDMRNISHPLLQVKKVKSTLFFCGSTTNGCLSMGFSLFYWSQIYISWAGPHLQSLSVTL